MVQQNLPVAGDDRLPTWNHVWDLILANPLKIIEDYQAAARSGIETEAKLEEPIALRGNPKDLFVGRGAKIHPMVVPTPNKARSISTFSARKFTPLPASKALATSAATRYSTCDYSVKGVEGRSIDYGGLITH